MAKKLSVVLTSGGLASAVAAAVAQQEWRLALLHFQYGQQAGQREAEAFAALCDWFSPARHQVVGLGQWPELCPSPLLQAGGDIEDARAVGQSLAMSFVPMLSATMLCAAAAWAYTLGADRVVWGVTLANPGNYPDRANAVRLLCWQLVSRCLGEDKAPVIDAPLSQYTYEAVVDLAVQLKVPINQTWSCLRGGAMPCGRCIGCTTRGKALEKAGAAKR
ncbi:MAG: 7-cyano-7-deazaguanine synthase [Planctomycetes bacterium]|nr:7-cyano-7-deazaguanine synthase [Planctomycetota bacterium]